MSFFHPSPAATARNRRAKDSQSRISTSNTSRRPKEGVKSRDERSPTPKSPSLQHSIYGQQNVGLEQLPELSTSGKTSPILAASPTVSANTANKRSSGLYHLPIQLVTPASLQQYLDADQDDEVTSNMTDSLHLPPPLPTDTSIKRNSDYKDLLTKEQYVKEHLIKEQLIKEQLAKETEFKDTPEIGPRLSQEDVKSIRSEPAGASLSKTTSAEDSAASYYDAPPPLSRSMSQATQNPAPDERSFTPPPLPLGMVQSQSPPLYMSPMPVRAHGPAQHFSTHHGGHGYYGANVSMPSSESVQTPLTAASFLPDYASRPNLMSQAATHRQRSYDVAGISSGRMHRSFSYAGFEDDTNGLLQRINSVLPDFHHLLERYRDVSGHVLGEQKPADDEADVRFEQEIKSKEAQVALLEKELQNSHESLASERERFQAQLSSIRKEHDELEAAASQKDELRRQNRELQMKNDSLGQQLRQNEAMLEQLRIEAAHNLATNTELSRQLELRSKSDTILREELAQAHSGKAHLSKQLVEKGEAESKLRAELEMAIRSKEKELHDKELRVREAEVKNLAAQEALRQETVRAVASHRRELEESQKKEMAAREGWRGEVETSQKREAQLRESHKQELEIKMRQWAEEREELVQHWGTRCRAQSEQHGHEKEDMQQMWRAAQAKLHNRHAQLEAEVKSVKEELEGVKASWQADKTAWMDKSTDLKALALRINHENHNLQMLAERLVERTPPMRRRTDAEAR